MALRFVMTEGVERAVNFYTERRASKIDPNAPGAQEMKAQTREQAHTIKRSLRMMRRFMRF